LDRYQSVPPTQLMIANDISLRLTTPTWIKAATYPYPTTAA
jgi:hypothetical protein